MASAKFLTKLESLAPEAVVSPSSTRHGAQFYSEDIFLIDALSRFLGPPLAAGDGVIVIATAPHRRELERNLRENGLDLSVALQQGRCAMLDAAETLASFMDGGLPDPRRFVELIGNLIQRTKAAAGGGDRQIFAFGEMVALLWEEGNAEAAIQLERLWNDVASSHDFHLRCAYPIKGFAKQEHTEAFLKICGEHTAIFPAEGHLLDEDRQRIIAQLQQKAAALENEIAQRLEIEKKLTILAAIVESSEDGIASKDLNGIVISWNAAAERIFGYRESEIVGRSITLIIPPELQQDEARILAKIRRGERIEHFETVRVAKDGRRIDVSLTVSPVKDADGTVIGAAKVVRDISQRKRTEEALRRAESLAATGQLAATIAHEINNPMQALSNLLALVSYRTSLDDKTRQLVALADGELTRMSHITRQMLSFYRESTSPAAVKVTEVLEDVLELFVMRLRSNRVMLERRYEFTGEIRGFAMELGQLFANLLSNAIEAVGDKGRIYVHVAPRREWSKPEREGVQVVIADSGPGIARELHQQIFEPFFTTKAEKGTGLGLWVVRGIVAKHGGSIRMRSSTKPGRSGTVFSLFLPLQVDISVLSPEATLDAATTLEPKSLT